LRAALLFLCLHSVAAWAEVPVPPLTARVTDLTNTLDAQQRSALEQRLAAFEQQKGAQVAVLIVPSTQPETIEQYSIRVTDQWKLGRKGVDDGVLLLLAKDDRTLRIEVGYGLEGSIPDAIANRIIEELMVPKLRQGDFVGAIGAGIDGILQRISGEPLPEPPKQRSSSKGLDSYFPVLFFVAIVVGDILRSVLGNFLGGAATGGVLGVLAWVLGAGLIFALIIAVVGFIITLGGGSGFHGGGLGGRGGGFGSGFGSGGGGFGGGGASGRW
jgi:uncharacterized protein